MPWNCLCASKEKRSKLEISAPILNIEDSSNLQLASSSLKSKRPLVLPAAAITKQTKQKSITDNDLIAINKKNSSSNNNKKNGIIITKSGKKINENVKIAGSSSTTNIPNGTKKSKNSDNNINAKSGKQKITKIKNNKRDEQKNLKLKRNSVKFSNNKNTKTESILLEEEETLNDSNQIENFDSPPIQGAIQMESNNTINFENREILQCKCSPQKQLAERLENSNEQAVSLISKDTHFNIEKFNNTIDNNVEKSSGDYDEIPFAIDSKELTTFLCGPNEKRNIKSPQMNTTTTLHIYEDSLHNLDSIPYIDDELLVIEEDDEDRESTKKFNQNFWLNEYNARFITLHPRNIASPQTIAAGATLNRKFNSTLIKTPNSTVPTILIQKSSTDSEDDYFIQQHQEQQQETENNQRIFELNNNIIFNKFILNGTNQQFLLPQQYVPQQQYQQLLQQQQQLQQNVYRHLVEHDFHSWKLFKGKLCQLCHESLMKKPSLVVKCRQCELICHSWCASLVPSIRYHDTAYIINRKWLRGEDELAFPILHHYANSDEKIRGNNKNSQRLDHYATDTETNERVKRRKSIKDRQQRRTRSLERRRHLQLIDDPITTTDDDFLDEKRTKRQSIINENNKSNINVDNNKKSLFIDEEEIDLKENVGDQNNNNKKNVILRHEINIVKLEVIGKPKITESSNQLENEEKESQKILPQDVDTVNGEFEIKINDNEIAEQEANDDETIAIMEEFDSKASSERNSIAVSEATTNNQPTIRNGFPKIDFDDSTTESRDEVDNINHVIDSRNLEIVVDIHPRPSSVASSTVSNDILQINEETTDDEYYVTKENVPDFIRRSRKLRELEKEIKRNSGYSNVSDKTLTDTGESTPNSPTKQVLNGIQRCKNHYYLMGNNSSSAVSSSTSTINEYDDESSMDDYEVVDNRKIFGTTSDQNSNYQHLPPKNNNNDNEIRFEDSSNVPKSQTFPVQTKYLSQQSQQQQPNKITDNLRLHYVTQRILASILPKRAETNDEDIIQSIGPDNESKLQDRYEKEVILMLDQKHGKNYRVFDLESCISVITLERICELCKHIDKWLGSGQEKVVVLQDREDRQRLGVAIAGYLEYLDICASNFNGTNKRNSNNEDLHAQNAINKNWLDLDIFSMKKFLEDFIGPLRIPSHKRYLRYFSGLLSGRIRMNASSLLLKYIAVESPPSLLQYHGISSDTEWNSFIKIYEGLRCVYTSDIHIIPIATRQFLYQIGNLQLRGDILIRCYQILSPFNNNYQSCNGGGGGNRSSSRLSSENGNEDRELLFSLQFHTCAMTSKEVSFRKDDLDYAWCDNRFPRDCKITFHFQGANDSNSNNYLFQSPLIRTEPPNLLAKADSIENFDLSTKYQGPVDGSLYATILKSPKASQPPQQIPLPSQRSSSLSVNLISPPPQFSNRHYEVTEIRPLNTSTPLRKSVEPSTHKTPNGSATLIRDTRSLPRSEYTYIESRPSTSQSNYRSGQRQSVEFKTRTQEVRNTHSHNNHHNGVRESVRSPLTLSVDSGISSNGLINKQHQASSTSPSSFPSQASPQEERHQELDDILSDMLMTVQDIPDFKSTIQKPRLHRSSSAAPTTTATAASQQSNNFFILPTQRSRSYTSTFENTVSPQHRDYYDSSASTATTVTPTPSESGRDTPIVAVNSGSEQHYQERQRSNTYSSMASTITTTTATSRSASRNENNNQQDQSSLYPQQRRTQKISFSETEDEDNIPYHARETSKPFTYGNVPNGHQLNETGCLVNGGDKILQIDTINLESESDPEKMIKTQPGLSSPSLVRKQLGRQSDTTLRKTPQRNDFEDMLRERREKVMSEKYTISDKNLPQNRTSDNKWMNTTINQTNGYHYYNEPLRRSNTLEGFHRSSSTDGLSGQTWLQLQQQKLRAKKNQQLSDERKYFEEIHAEIRNRPLRSRVRYDGYASDTAAFGDEVDYRRPLNVQTTYNLSRSPERKYNTIQTTTTSTTVNKERPFVAVKRAHEQAKRETVGSPSLSPLSLLNAAPIGHITHLQQQQQNQEQINHKTGLLSMADSPTRNGHTQLEFVELNSNNDNAINACKNVNSSQIINNHNNSQTSIVDNTNSNSSSTTTIMTTTTTNNSSCTPPTVIEYKINQHSNNNNNNYADKEIDKNIYSTHESYSSVVETTSLENLNNNNINGQLALDRLIASLAIEAELMSKQILQCQNNNNNINNQIDILNRTTSRHNSAGTSSLKSSDEYIPSSPSPSGVSSAFESNFNKLPLSLNNYNLVVNSNLVDSLNNNNNNNCHKTSNQKVQELNDVLANLTEFTRFEALRNGCDNQSNNSSSGSNHSNLNLTNGAIPRRLIATHCSESSESSISPSLSERSNHLMMWHDQVREESFSSYRSETDPELSISGSPRPETPAFPTTPRTPYGFANGSVSPALPPKSPTSQHRFNNSSWSLRSQRSAAPSPFEMSKDLYSTTQRGTHEIVNQNEMISNYTTRRNSNSSNANSEPQEVAPHLVKFVRDSSKYWYKPNLSREEAIALLRHAEPGTFLVRDSTTFKNAFGLVVRVAHAPPGVQVKPGGDELVRHFLVEPTSRGVRLKGCSNEPVFSSLSALVYQHSITPLALPCRLIIPDRDIQAVELHTPAQKQLLTQGAACNVLYLFACDTESLTGEEAVRRAVYQLYMRKPLPIPTEVHFKVSSQGITLTDNTRQKFFRNNLLHRDRSIVRRKGQCCLEVDGKYFEEVANTKRYPGQKHYSAHMISFCGVDPDRRTWSVKSDGDIPVNNKTIFAFVARRSASSQDNQCHVFCDLQSNQPATAIVSFANKVLPTEKIINHNI